jgi:RHS repeat-associated protein
MVVLMSRDTTHTATRIPRARGETLPHRFRETPVPGNLFGSHHRRAAPQTHTRTSVRVVLLANLVIALATSSPCVAQGDVDPRSGAFHLTVTDLALPAGAVELAVERSLLPEPRENGLLGANWRLNWERRLWRTDSVAVIERADGSTTLTRTDPTARYLTAHGESLVLRDDGTAVHLLPDGSSETFDSDGRLIGQDLRNGNVARLRYDERGLLSRIDGPKSSWIEFETDDQGRLTRLGASTGDVAEYRVEAERLLGVTVNGDSPSQYRYDDRGRLTHAAHPMAATVELDYDDEGRVVERRLGTDSIERHAYDPINRSYRRTDPTGATAVVQWSEDDLRQVVTDALGRQTVTEREPSGRSMTITGPDGDALRFVYDELGRTTAVASATGDTTQISYLEDTVLPVRISYPDGSIRNFSYDAARNLTAITLDDQPQLAYGYHADGQIAWVEGPAVPRRSYGYDSAGRLQSETDAMGKVTRFEYDEHGNPIREVDAAGGITRSEFDRQRRLVSITDPAGAVTRFVYDDAHSKATIVDPVGSRTEFSYDAAGRVTSMTDPAGRSSRYSYDPVGRLIGITDASGRSHRYEYDAMGQLVREIDATGGSTTIAYDSAGRVNRVEDPSGTPVAFEYSAAGDLARTVSPSGATNYGYDARSQPVVIEGPDGRAARIERDERGRVLSISHSSGHVERLDYDEVGRVRSISDNRGADTRYVYDALGRLTHRRLASGLEISYTYDALGNLIGREDSVGARLAVRYDPRGLPIATTDAVGASYHLQYDSAGRLAEHRDPMGNPTSLSYTAAGELSGITAPSGDSARYVYDPSGYLSEIHHPSGGTTRLESDGVGRLLTEIDPVGGTRRFSYDRAGRLIRRTDALGGSTSLRYDTTGRLVEKRLPDGTAISYTWTERDRLSAVDDGRYPKTYEYDDTGRLVSVSWPRISKSIGYAYDEVGRLATFTGPSGGVTRYQYDDAGRLHAMTLDDGDVVRFSYDAGDRLVSLAYPNGITGSWSYDARGLVTRVAWVGSDGGARAEWRCRYDVNGYPVETIRDGEHTTAFAYDASGRLVDESRAGETIRYRYAPGGNLAERHGPDGVVRLRTDAADRLLEAGSETFVHDAAGRLIERRGPTATTRYHYDAEDRLIRADLSDGEAIRFGYAPTGERIRRDDPDGVTHFVSDGTHLLAELDAQLEVVAVYDYAPGVDRPLRMVRSGTKYYYLVDALGTVGALADADGRVVVRYRSDAFGRPLVEPAADANPLRFTGREFDSELGLYYFRARYYDPALCRFLTPDPVRALPLRLDGLNRYAYAFNAPTRFVDPFGTYPTWKPQWNTRPYDWLPGDYSLTVVKPGRSPFPGYGGGTKWVPRPPAGPPGPATRMILGLPSESQPIPVEPISFEFDVDLDNIMDLPLAESAPQQPVVVKPQQGPVPSNASPAPPRPEGNLNVTRRAPAYNPPETPGTPTRIHQTRPGTSTVRVEPPARATGSGNPPARPPSAAGPVQPVPQVRKPGLLERVYGPAGKPTFQSLKDLRNLGWGGGLAVVGTGVSSFLIGQQERAQMIQQAIREGREPDALDYLWAGLKASARSVASVLTFGLSETGPAIPKLVVDETFGIGAGRALYTKSGAEEAKRAWAQKVVRDTKLSASIVAAAKGLADQAAALHQAQTNDTIAVREVALTLEGGLGRVRSLVPKDSPTQVCGECRAKASTLAGLIPQARERLTTVRAQAAQAKSQTAGACDSNDDDAIASSTRAVVQAAGSAQRATDDVVALSDQGRKLAEELAACIGRLEAFAQADSELERLEDTIAFDGLEAFDIEQLVRGYPAQCASLQGRLEGLCSTVRSGEGLTGDAVSPTYQKMLDQLERVHFICREISANRDNARSYVDAIARSKDAIYDLVGRISAVWDCKIDVDPEGVMRELDSLAGEARAAHTEAQGHLSRANDCAQRVAAGGASTTSSKPGAVAASGVDRPGDEAVEGPGVGSRTPDEPGRDTAKPGVVAASSVSSGDTTTATAAGPERSVGGGRDTIEIVYANVDLELAQDDYGIYDTLENIPDTEIIVRIGGVEQQLFGADAVAWLLKQGYLDRRDGVGLIATDRLKRFLGLGESGEEPPQTKTATGPSLLGGRWEDAKPPPKPPEQPKPEPVEPPEPAPKRPSLSSSGGFTTSAATMCWDVGGPDMPIKSGQFALNMTAGERVSGHFSYTESGATLSGSFEGAAEEGKCLFGEGWAFDAPSSAQMPPKLADYYDDVSVSGCISASGEAWGLVWLTVAGTAELYGGNPMRHCIAWRTE